MKYKVGDQVRIKSLEWYNKNKDITGDIIYKNGPRFSSYMRKYCGQTMTIRYVYSDAYRMKEDCPAYESGYFWTDDMIECKVEEETCTSLNIYKDGYIHGGNVVGNEITLPEGYIFKDENGNEINAQKIVLEKKKTEYPKTYEECCKVLGIPKNSMVVHYCKEKVDYEVSLSRKLRNMQKLYICRDAYWKIAGEEMGLDKSWKPINAMGYCTYAIIHHTGHIRKSRPYADSALLEFPTEEMRDKFFENFKFEIESCKELL